MNYTISKKENCLVLEVQSLISETDNKRIIADVVSKLEAGINKCVVDIAEIDIMNSIGLNFLIAILRNAKKKGGDMVIVNPSKQVLRLLEITKLASIFNLSPSVEAALETKK